MPRPRLRRSSIVVGIVVGIILVLVTVPGRIVDGEPWFWMTLEHGWPFNYLRREAKGSAPAPRNNTLYYGRLDFVAAQSMLGVPWLGRDNWRLWEAPIDETREGKETPRWEFSGMLLACDLAIALVVIVGVVSMWELRRRRRPGLFSFALSDMLFAVASLCAVLGWLVHQQREFRREERLIDAELFSSSLADKWYREDEVCIAPVFVRSLIGERLLPAFLWRTCEIELDLENGERANLICEELSCLEHLTRIDLVDDSSQGFPYAALRPLKQLNTLDISSSYDKIDERDISGPAMLTQLRKIVVDFEEEIPADVVKRFKAELPECKIVDRDYDW
jgi:hypothetical protein